ncbi:MAG: HDIG domain-containing protein [Waddliaceae bacterium]|jgi:cyclic-di-AMP phosphodiesterase PgpH|nr:HDIG domain-containing protein [Waddliaceae bacterium]MBT3578715.1 HDIG domain-containing protein [Waddliaceae bacterium]MBT4444383.1 HDIG domain-containing protein [Waddliaceae bacterium]MBT6928298.1 HDIG domain-containing protein [Waddliaceae bacterium]MBT7264984.1 HDIG domain-containing protein [Waddliaceae bacterium]
MGNNNEFKKRFSRGASGLKFPREQGFFDKSFILRVVVLLLFSVGLFAVLHFREIHVDTLELNKSADRYIVAQTNFSFHDAKATESRREEALLDIGKIYRFNKKEVHQRRVDFERYLVYNKSWRKQSERSTFEEMYSGIDDVEKMLLSIRLTDPRTIQKIKQFGMTNRDYLVYITSDVTKAINVPKRIWEHIEKIALTKNIYQPGTIDFIITYFKGKGWDLVEDGETLGILRNKATDSIPKQYTRVNAGDRIIGYGDKVTEQHIAMIHAMKKTLAEGQNIWHYTTIVGSAVMTALFIILGIMYLNKRFPDILRSNRKILLLCSIIAIAFIFSKLAEHIIINSSINLFEVIRYPLFVPFAAMLLCTLMNMEIALVVSVFLAVVLSMTLALNKEFMIINLVAAVIAILGSTSFRSRKKIFAVCAKAWIGCIVFIVALGFYRGNIISRTVSVDIFTTMLFMIFTAVLVIGILPLIEFAFPIMTDAILMEYLDPNNEILTRLAMEAPGTYQHSIVVGNLAERAAQSIGANGLFCKVVSLYHDVGKLRNPQYFTENEPRGTSMHQLLTPTESAQVITEHISEGVALARKFGLPEQFVDVIKEHHGTMNVRYFYNNQKELMDGDASRVNEKDFKYTGPTAHSKESAIIMIADAFEAASRSLEAVNKASLKKLINNLVKERLESGQFDECMLTFEELGTVKESLVSSMLMSTHSRIKYSGNEDEEDDV